MARRTLLFQTDDTMPPSEPILEVDVFRDVTVLQISTYTEDTEGVTIKCIQSVEVDTRELCAALSLPGIGFISGLEQRPEQ